MQGIVNFFCGQIPAVALSVINKKLDIGELFAIYMGGHLIEATTSRGGTK